MIAGASTGRWMVLIVDSFDISPIHRPLHGGNGAVPGFQHDIDGVRGAEIFQTQHPGAAAQGHQAVAAVIGVIGINPEELPLAAVVIGQDHALILGIRVVKDGEAEGGVVFGADAIEAAAHVMQPPLLAGSAVEGFLRGKGADAAGAMQIFAAVEILQGAELAADNAGIGGANIILDGGLGAAGLVGRAGIAADVAGAVGFGGILGAGLDDEAVVGAGGFIPLSRQRGDVPGLGGFGFIRGEAGNEAAEGIAFLAVPGDGGAVPVVGAGIVQVEDLVGSRLPGDDGIMLQI